MGVGNAFGGGSCLESLLQRWRGEFSASLGFAKPGLSLVGSLSTKLTSVRGYSLAKRSVHPLQQSYTLQRTVVLRSCAITLYALAIRSLSDRMLNDFMQ